MCANGASRWADRLFEVRFVLAPDHVRLVELARPVLDRSTTEIFAARLAATDPKGIVYALELFDTEQRKEVHRSFAACSTIPPPK
jgi:hypothetical protein